VVSQRRIFHAEIEHSFRAECVKVNLVASEQHSQIRPPAEFKATKQASADPCMRADGAEIEAVALVGKQSIRFKSILLLVAAAD
jgi:hypothetical protein